MKKTTAHSNQPSVSRTLLKDEKLDYLADIGNVAQFVSFGPNLEIRYSRVKGYRSNFTFRSPLHAVSELLRLSRDSSVNIRTFLDVELKSGEFLYGLETKDSIISALNQLSARGLYTIVNETIDIHDGGVSGVASNNVIEFCPDDTPRCVEKTGVLSVSLKTGIQLLEAVYGFRPELVFDSNQRVEFSIHPIRRGFRNSHTVLWEIDDVDQLLLTPKIKWPNKFSKLIGDKAFGLLVVHLLGFSVPRSLVISRRIAPFQFGKKTRLKERWIRTCPALPMPGIFPTYNHWVDPFQVLAQSDPNGDKIASVIVQDAIRAGYSGAVLSGREDTIVEGVPGEGQKLMLGEEGPQPIPEQVHLEVARVFDAIRSQLGEGRMEWVFDGHKVWVVQFQQEATESSRQEIVAGNPKVFHQFDVKDGLAKMNSLIKEIRDSGDGIILIGNVGLTSHFADTLRRNNIPSRIEAVAPNLS